MALTVQTNTKKYCSYLYNNIDFSDKRFNLIIYTYVLYLPIYVLFYHFTFFNSR